MKPSATGSFPKNFVWGAATAAFQIEGAAGVDGKGQSVWDMMCRKPGAVFRGHTGDIACDHYHRWREDIGLMREMGLHAYRFSVSWPRVLPAGSDRANEAGLAFYDRLVDGLLAAGIEPFVTLFHWDYPLDLYQRGGWLNPDSPRWFADYAELLARRLGDRVKNWITLNEPQCFVPSGHLNGNHAPGDRLEMSQVLRVLHHSLLAHGLGVQALRANAGTDIRVGISLTSGSVIPHTESPADIEAAREAYFDINESLFCLSMWSDPLYLGRYPEKAWRMFAGKMPVFPESDMAVIRQPLDFIGYNCYTGSRVSAGEPGKGPVFPEKPAGNPVGALGWIELADDSLYWAARFQTERYGKIPFLITENGVAITDWVALDGRVRDPQRIDYVTRYLRGLRRAADEGIPVAGYFYWSLMDNFEWAEGYRPRFGLVHVDYETQVRTIKESGHWYRRVIESNGTLL